MRFVGPLVFASALLGVAVLVGALAPLPTYVQIGTEYGGTGGANIYYSGNNNGTILTTMHRHNKYLDLTFTLVFPYYSANSTVQMALATPLLYTVPSGCVAYPSSSNISAVMYAGQYNNDTGAPQFAVLCQTFSSVTPCYFNMSFPAANFTSAGTLSIWVSS